MTKSGRKAAPRTPAKTKGNGAAVRMTTGQAVVSSLLAHGIDTVYALPGVHNDHFFDALYKAGNRVRVVHTRHEQGCAYMALGAALATGKPQTYCVVPGPGLLNTGAALLTAYSMNAPVLALIGQIPQNAIRRDLGHLHEIRDQAGIIDRLVDHSARIPRPADAPRMVAAAMQAMFTDRPGPAALECAMDVWGRVEPVRETGPLAVFEPPIDDDAIAAAAKLLGRCEKPDDRLRRRRAGCRHRGGAAVRHAAGSGARLSARPRYPRQPRSALDHAAAGARDVARGRCGDRCRHPPAAAAHGHGAPTRT